MKRSILCIDLKSFYATCECVKRGWDPFQVKLAVVGNTEQRGSIVLAISPALKQVFPHSRCRLYELPMQYDIVKVQANMEYYVKKAKEVIAVYLEFVATEDLHVYSVDEAFLDVSGYLNYYGCDPYTLAKRILERIQEKTKLIATCGIGENLLLAKVALDIDSKKMKEGIAWWKKEEIETTLWKIEPLSKMWGIGKRMEERLNYYHILTVGELARTPKEFLESRFGVMGVQLHEHANGIDESQIQEKYVSKSHSLSSSQMLMRDYDEIEIKVIIKEQLEELLMRLRDEGLLCGCLQLGIEYSYGGGFSRQQKSGTPTNSAKELMEMCVILFKEFYEGEPIRRVTLGFSSLVGDEVLQLSLFDDRGKEDVLGKAVDQIRHKYGKEKVVKCISLLSYATGKERMGKMGGHTR